MLNTSYRNTCNKRWEDMIYNVSLIRIPAHLQDQLLENTCTLKLASFVCMSLLKNNFDDIAIFILA